MMKKISVALIGAGSMGGALLKGWLAYDTIDIDQSAVFDPGASAELKALCAEHRLSLNPVIDSLVPDVVLIAIKPQKADALLPAYAGLAKDAVSISVMAGKSIASISKALGGATRVARTMPNLPAAIGKGVTGLYAPNEIDAEGRRAIETLMAAAGETVWVNSEEQIDYVTAVSGSGPAYYFLLTEALADAGEALGFDRTTAEKLALATLTGAGALMDVETRTPAQMRSAVTSPGGTTEAALNIFDGDDHRMRMLVKEAVAAAAKRAAELTE